MKKLDLLKLNLKQNKFLKWEREKALEAEYPWVFICNNNKQKDFIKRNQHLEVECLHLEVECLHLETEWNLQAILKERAPPEHGCDESTI